jgi:hypothetical protein
MKPLAYIHPSVLPAAPVQAAPLSWQCAEVAQRADDGWLLRDGRLARQALCCLVTPAAADQVLVLQAGDALYLTHVLARESQAAQLSAPGMRELVIAQPALRLEAGEQIALHSGGDVTLSAPQGSVAVAARNFLATVAESLVQDARHLVTHAQHCVLQVAGLLRLHGRQALVTAQQDLKIDAERVTLG